MISVYSTDADLQCIHDWLTKQKQDGVTDSFRSNWKQISIGHQTGMLLVAVEPIDSEPVAFQLDGYLARASDPPPGNKILWGGLTRLHDIHLGYLLAKGDVGN